MKLTKIGLLCGLSSYSTKIYYDRINKQIARALGDRYSANIIMNSINNGYADDLLQENKLDVLKQYLLDECKSIERCGVKALAISCNTVHYFLDYIEPELTVPVISILDVVSRRAAGLGVAKVGIVATNFSIKNKIYQNKLEALSVDSVVPDVADRLIVNRIITNLCSGFILDEDKNNLKKIIQKLQLKGAEAVILGCTELGLLISQLDFEGIHVLDSCLIHSEELSKIMLDTSGYKSSGFKEVA